MNLSKDKLRKLIEEQLESLELEELEEAGSVRSQQFAKKRQKAGQTAAQQQYARAVKAKGLGDKVDEIFEKVNDFVSSITDKPDEVKAIYQRIVMLARKKFGELEEIEPEQAAAEPEQAPGKSDTRMYWE